MKNGINIPIENYIRIEKKFLDKPLLYETDRSVLKFGGIVSHVNYRSSGKEDIGPAFDWSRVIKGVT